MGDKIKRFIECFVPVTACNLRCHYCYVIQENRRTEKIPQLKYSLEHIAKALSKERFGGICYFSICAAGETLLSNEVAGIVHKLLSVGHYVNITTNGTLTKRFNEIAEFSTEELKRLNISFSFHYLELKRLNLLETFFKNVNLVKKIGCSFIIQFNMCDEYIPYLDIIKELCLENAGAMPQIALTRDEKSNEIKLFSKLSPQEYLKLGDSFNSPLYKFTNQQFMHKQKNFCYAGDWSFVLDIFTGDLKRCYHEAASQNLYINPDKPIKFQALGKNCKLPYCVNSSHFLSLGVVPNLNCPTYCDLRNRTCTDNSEWLTPKVKEFLSSKLSETNEEYSGFKKAGLWAENLADKVFSVKNIYSNGVKHKKITVLGAKFSFKE